MGYWEYEPIARRHRRSRSWSPASSRLIFCRASISASGSWKQGRAEVENQYSRSVRREGNRAAQAALARSFHRSDAELARDRRNSLERPRPRALPMRVTMRCGVFPALPRPPERGSECISGEILRGLRKPVRLPGLRHKLHAGASARRDHGFVGRRLRRLLPLSPPRRREPGGNPMSGASDSRWAARCRPPWMAQSSWPMAAVAC